jgi:asparagine synthase (glutamine-hydrolysing)
VPTPLRKLAKAIVKDPRLAKLERFAAVPEMDTVLFNSSYLRPELARELAPRLAARLSFRQERLAESAVLGLDTVSRTSLLDQETFLISILHRQDKMSMAAAIESRVPFMDYRIVEFANRLPTPHKIANGSGKAIVKTFARTVLPAPIVDRRKSGFGVPLAEWFRSPAGLGALLPDLPSRRGADVFDGAVLERKIAEHRSGACDHSEMLWTALNLATWRETFGV